MENEQEDEKLLMNGQEVQLKNPGVEGFPSFLKVARDMSSGNEEDGGKDFMKNLSDSGIDALTKLIELTLKKSFPQMYKDDKEALDQWGMANAFNIMMKVMDMCMPKNKSHEVVKKNKVLEKLNEQSKKPVLQTTE